MGVTATTVEQGSTHMVWPSWCTRAECCQAEQCVHRVCSSRITWVCANTPYGLCEMKRWANGAGPSGDSHSRRLALCWHYSSVRTHVLKFRQTSPAHVWSCVTCGPPGLLSKCTHPPSAVLPSWARPLWLRVTIWAPGFTELCVQSPLLLRAMLLPSPVPA